MTWGSHSSQPMHLQWILNYPMGIRRKRRGRRRRGGRRGTRVLADFATELPAGCNRAPIKINAFTAFLVTARSNDRVEATSSPDALLHQNGRRRSQALPSTIVLFLVRLLRASHLLRVCKALVVVPRESFSLALFSLDHSSPRCFPWIRFSFFVIIIIIIFFFVPLCTLSVSRFLLSFVFLILQDEIEITIKTLCVYKYSQCDK